MKAIRETLPDDGIVVDEVTQLGYIIWYGYPVHQPRRLVSSGFSGTLGYGFPTALGVKVANPDRPVVSVTGDGGFLFGGSDLSTAKQFGINLVTVLVNNASYGNVKRDQERLYEGRHSGAVLHNPDFQAYARSFGVPAWRVETADAFRGALREALAADSPGDRRSRLGHQQGLSALQVPSTEVALMANAPTVERQRRAYVPDDAWLAKRPKEPILEPDLPIVDPHHHLWDHANHRYLLDELVADTGTGHNITATVYIDCRSMYRADGPKEMRPVGETEFATASRP